MGFQVSPGVNVTERDLTTIVPAVATTSAGMAGAFRWGPVGERVLVDSENELRNIFGDPDKYNYNWFFTAANFLGYGNNLQIVRVAGVSASNANSDSSAVGRGIRIDTRTSFDGNTATASAAEFIGKYPGHLGNSIRVAVFDNDGKTGPFTTRAISLGGTIIGISGGGVTSAAAGGFSDGNPIGNYPLQKGDRILWSNGDVNTVLAAVAGVCGGTGASDLNTITVAEPIQNTITEGSTFEIQNRYASLFTSTPRTSGAAALAGGTNDELNIAVVDYDGRITGTEGEVLETYEGLSKAFNARGFDGRDIFYKNVLNDQSQWVYARANVAGMPAGDSNTSTSFDLLTEVNDAGYYGANGVGPSVGATLEVGGVGNAQSHALVSGADANQYGTVIDLSTVHGGTGHVLSDSDVWNGYREFEDTETVDVSLILGAMSTAAVQTLIIDMVDKRKDAIAFLSPVLSAENPAGLVENKTTQVATVNVRNFRNSTLNKSSSYAVLDSGFKKMLDRYNNVLRSVPLNGDIAGLCARTEREQEAWFSPAGFNRGQIRGVVKLEFNPRQAHRDNLYIDQINPVVSFPGEGTVLFGDKTLQSKPSAFDRINVRRLFIVLEKAIATASKFLLFEFNDEFTRAQFRNMVIPFLRTVQSRRGITDFKVVCDESNNTGEVIDRNEFVGDIFIKPARSINFIQLNFIATRTGVDFSEVGG